METALYYGARAERNGRVVWKSGKEVGMLRRLEVESGINEMYVIMLFIIDKCNNVMYI